MKRLRMLLTAILTGALLLTGCTPKPPTGNDTPKTGQPAEKPRRPELTQPIESALLSLQAMNASGKNKDIPGAQEHFGQFRTHWAEVKAVLDKEDPKLAVHIEDGAVELDLEFAKPSDQFRFYELDEETVKLGRLLSKAADLLGAPIRAELVQKDPTQDIPFNQEQRIEITLVDHKIQPERIEVDQHTKVTFVITNKGVEVHEFALDHYAVEEEDILPGQTRELTLVVLDAGTFETACHLPGHYEVGMHGELVVRPAELKKK